MDRRMLPAEIARAHAVLEATRASVKQDIRIYGRGHVSKINVSRYAAAHRYLGYLHELAEHA